MKGDRPGDAQHTMLSPKLFRVFGALSAMGVVTQHPTYIQSALSTAAILALRLILSSGPVSRASSKEA